MSERERIVVAGAAHDGTLYDQSSQTQRAQGLELVSLIPEDFPDTARVADIGCGNGKTTLDMCTRLPRDAYVLGSDVSTSQIEMAKQNLANARAEGKPIPENISFYVADALDIGTTPKTSKLDLIVSNAALHWVRDGKTMYGKIRHALAPEGKIVIQQGGANCYAGLARIAFQAAADIGVGRRFENWQYPLFYPSRQGMETILNRLGFHDVTVSSLESDGKQYPELYKNYADAGLLPFMQRAGERAQALKEQYLAIAADEQAAGTLDTYTHRLVVTATK